MRSIYNIHAIFATHGCSLNIRQAVYLQLSCLFNGKAGKLLAYVWGMLAILAVLFTMLMMTAAEANARSRIKDIVAVEGIRDNILVGYGLVVGLNGTGDNLNNSTFTEKSLEAFLERLGVNVSDKDVKAKNVAAVTLTATLPPFARSGSRIDVTVSTLGDAKSLQGGTLVATPIMGADGRVYAVAQGAVATGGFQASGEATTISKGVPTNGFIANGAIIEREIAFELNSLSNLNLALRNPDIATASRIADAINTAMLNEAEQEEEFYTKEEVEIARVRDPATVAVDIPEEYRDSVASLLAKIEQLEVQPDQKAKIIIDEASGTIVMNENVRIDTVAISQGNLVVTIKEELAVSQPGVLAPQGAETVAAPVTTIAIDENVGNQMAVMDSGASLRELVGGLNALGVGPRDLIGILQTVKAAGALQAEIVTQ